MTIYSADEQDFRICNDGAVLGLSTGADARTLGLECNKMTNEDVVCRAITTDGNSHETSR
jgi:hypothetical protein